MLGTKDTGYAFWLMFPPISEMAVQTLYQSESHVCFTSSTLDRTNMLKTGVLFKAHSCGGFVGWRTSPVEAEPSKSTQKAMFRG